MNSESSKAGAKAELGEGQPGGGGGAGPSGGAGEGGGAGPSGGAGEGGGAGGGGSAGLARSAGLVGLATLASRVLGLVRDMVIAAFFDKGRTDAFFVAFTIPNVLRRLLAEGSLTVAFIPVFTEYRSKGGDESARRLLAATLGPALLVLALVCLLGALFAPSLVRLFAFGLSRDPERFQLAVGLTRVMFPFLLTVGLVALAMGVLNTYGHFLTPAIAPVLLNVGIISATVLTPRWLSGLGVPPVFALAIGVLVGGVAQVVLQLPALGRRSLLVRPKLELRHEGVQRIGRLMLPSIAGLAIYQVNVILSRQFASFLEEGAISFLYYAQRFIEFPIGIFATAMATVAMPQLSKYAADGDTAQLKQTYRFTLRIVAFVMLPATLGLCVLAEPLISVLFQRGVFSPYMTQQTAWTLVGFSVGLCAAGSVRQTVPVFYSLQDTRTPVKVSALALMVYAAAALVCYRPLGTFGLALAVSISSTVHFGVLLMLLRRRLGPLGLRGVSATVGRSAVAAIACAGAAWGIARAGQWRLGGARPSNYVIVLLALGAGVGVYLLASRLLRAPELRELRAAVRRR
jgi:putative peptidoglycan lipid II flippase